MNLPVTEVQAEVWVLWFDPGQLRTMTEVGTITDHSAVSNLLDAALRKLKSRTEMNPPLEEEQKLIDLAYCVTGAKNLDDAIRIRKSQVWRQVLSLRHSRSHLR